VLTVVFGRLWLISTSRGIGPRKGMRILDLAAGTGTSSAALAAHGAQVVAADFSKGMLEEGRRRHAGNELIEFVWADATALPFDDDSFDAATISYGLRNVVDHGSALAEMLRVVRPGGRLVVSEFSTPTWAPWRATYTFFLGQVLPRVAKLSSSNNPAYGYLAESIKDWPDQEGLTADIRAAGWRNVQHRNLAGGIVAIHRARRPEGESA
jgi:demethylmenaquinone methyltransferase/2-methoxy-6-polyprenyl-1,4-benzoquinol methylase